MKPIDHRLYFVAETGFASGVMADTIDPERTNIELPFLIQRIEFAYGAESKFVQRTICLAFQLLDPTHLPLEFDNDCALKITIEVASALAAIADMISDLQRDQSEIRAKGEQGQISLSSLPRTANFKGRMQQCIAHLREVQIAVTKLAVLFYPKAAPKDRWDAQFRPAVLDAYDRGGGDAEHIASIFSFLDEVAHHRAAMIHTDNSKSVALHDYDLQPDGSLLAPTIEITHPESAVPRMDAAQFLELQLDGISNVFEVMLCWLCDLNRRTLGDMFETSVAELPADQRRNGSRFDWQTTIKEGYSLPASA